MTTLKLVAFDSNGEVARWKEGPKLKLQEEYIACPNPEGHQGVRSLPFEAHALIDLPSEFPTVGVLMADQEDQSTRVALKFMRIVLVEA